uniref:3'-5' exonuclease domain-containing protein n=1 Tax=Strigamia maritima TaxID=126957 RepID=T1IRH0_STRMM
MTVVCAGTRIYEDEKVKIVTQDGEYEGVVTLAKNHRLVLIQVKSLTSGITFHGSQTFLESEVIQADVLESPKNRQSCDEMKNVLHSANGSSTSRFIWHLKENEKKMDDFDSQVTDNVTEDVTEQSCLVMITALDQCFYDAITHIKSNKIIGVAAEGINVDRNVDLCLLQIDTKNTVFLFDTVVMGNEFFQNGLSDIMTSKRILKVIHNCRELSGLLARQYEIKLQNVFDTQVADVMVYKMNNGGSFPKYVCSLSNCLINVLDMDNNDVNCLTIREGHEKEDKLIWVQRPLPLRLVDAAVKNVVNLRRLRQALLVQLLSEISRGTEIYINAYKRTRESFEEHLLPTQFANMVKCEHKPKRQQKSNAPQLDESGFILNKMRNHDWRLRFHRDACHMDRNPEAPNFSDEEEIVDFIKNAKYKGDSPRRRMDKNNYDYSRSRSMLSPRLHNNGTKRSQKPVDDGGRMNSNSLRNSERWRKQFNFQREDPQESSFRRGNSQQYNFRSEDPEQDNFRSEDPRFGRWNLQQSSFGRGNPQQSSFGRGNPQQSSFGGGNSQQSSFGRGNPQQSCFGRGNSQQPRRELIMLKQTLYCMDVIPKESTYFDKIS